MNVVRIRPCLAALTLLFAVSSTFSASAQKVQIDTEWIFEADAAHADSTVHAVLQVDIQEGYHIQSNAPLDPFLIATSLSFELPEGIERLETVFPEHLLLNTQFSNDPLAAFEGRILIGLAFKVGPDVDVGDLRLQGTFRYQACDDKACFQPRNKSIEATLKIVAPDTTLAMINAELLKDIAFTGIREEPVTPDVSGPAPEPILAVDDCDVVMAFEDFTVIGTTGGYLKSSKFLEFIDQAESGEVQKGFFEGKGPLAIILLVTIGGLALNLTPCVLPLVPINMAIIGAGAQAGSRARGFALGGTYGLAMAIVYGALGVIVILTAGTFGVINSTVWFNVAIAILFVVLGLAMFDIIAIDFSKFQTKFNMTGKAKKGTFLLAFGMGGITALLAGACVAPW